MATGAAAARHPTRRVAPLTTPARPIPLTFLDWVSAIMDSPSCPLDFSVILHLPAPLPADALERGAISARRAYPTSGARLEGASWFPGGAPAQRLEVVESTEAEAIAAIGSWMRRPFDLAIGPPVRQLLVRCGGAADRLVTRFHHALCDGVSAGMWLEHQLCAARGFIPAVPESQAHAAPVLRVHPRPRRRSRFAYRRPAQTLCKRITSNVQKRRWINIRVDAQPFRAWQRRIRGVTLCDMLAACFLDTLHEWNLERGGSAAARRIALWMPVNIRADPEVGFGNGTSRIRVYRRWASDTAWPQRCHGVREQVRWSLSNGEWASPSRNAPSGGHGTVAGGLLRAYFRRPWVDMGTAAFSVVDRWGGSLRLALGEVSHIELIGPLARRHGVGLNGVIRGDDARLTLTYDAERISDAESTELVSRLQRTISGMLNSS